MIAIFTAGGVALLIAGFGTPVLLRWLSSRRIGQQIREDGPAIHLVKAGTPTMGGLAIIAAVAGGYFLGHVGTHVPLSAGGVLVVAAVVLAGAIGLADDWLKVRRRRSLGLNKRAKLALQLAVGVGFSLAAVYLAGARTTLSFTRFDVPGIALGAGVWTVWATFVIVAEANAVNLTDGLDGLAAGSSAFSFTCLTLIGYWEFRHAHLYGVAHRGLDALDLALAAIAMGGACVGFLWWNAAPARIFMGDTGSLAIGTGLACIALELNLALLLPVIGGLFLVVTLSVVAQVVAFRCFGTRIFRMAPLHHHFELVGWPETTVIVRFWIFSGLCTAVALGVFYADFLGVRKL
ncbi:MAG TPA: phospho-N-acetylmuramoyl-pentapeptide-transferase [Acidimicrobiales bacterium]|nr:phospho-N-acetylmuramoyl-pentapeptide-transferase [Acidimicrobiales bacterium]